MTSITPLQSALFGVSITDSGKTLMKATVPKVKVWDTIVKRWVLGAWDTCFSGLWLPQWRWVAYLWIAAHLFFGLWFWYYFLNGGSIQLELHDWSEAAKRYAILQDAVLSWRLPLHAPGTSALRGVTDRFISVADTNLSPQVLLLRVMDIGQFALANTVLLYVLGFGGLLHLRHRLRLSPVAFSFIFLLFTFNGHITSHIAVGHLHWGAYLLAPCLVAAILWVADTPERWAPVLVAAGLTSFIFLQGALHLYAMVLLAVGLMPVFDKSLWKAAARLLTLSVLASLPRILPAALNSNEFDTAYLGGFPSTADVWSGLVSLRGPEAMGGLVSSQLSPLGCWEFDYYVGLAGVVLISVCLLQALPALPGVSSRTRALVLPGMFFVVLSIGRFYRLIHLLHLPILDSQRVGARLLFVPVIIALMIAAIQLQKLIDAKSTGQPVRLVVLAFIALLGADVWQHGKLWRVTNMGLVFSPVPLDLSRFYVANHSDPAYVAALGVGLALAVGALGCATVLAIREWRIGRRAKIQR